MLTLKKVIPALIESVQMLKSISELRHSYACPECGYNKSTIYRIYTTRVGPDAAYCERYAVCRQCGARILQQVINVKVIKGRSNDE